MLTIKNAVQKLFSSWNLCWLALSVILFAGCMPPGPRALLEGKKRIDQGRYPEAIEQLKLATSLLSTNARAWSYLGLAYQSAGQVPNAVQAYQRALALNQDLVEVHYNLGCLWLDQNRLDSAKSEFITFTSFRRNSIEGWLKLASAQWRSVPASPASARAQELAAAQKSYDEALRVNPQSAEALNGLGLIQLARNRPREAAQFFAHALKAQPQYPAALLNLAIVSQVYLNDHAAALQYYRQFVAVSDRTPARDAAQVAIRQLEGGLKPAPRAPVVVAAAAPAIATPPPPKPVAKPAAPPSNPPTPIAQTSSATVTASQPSPEANLKVVQLQPQPAIRPARDSAPRVAPSTSQTRPTSPPKSESDSSKAQKRGFLAKMNPFHRDAQTNAIHSSGASESQEPLPRELRGPRYVYHSPAKPQTGDTAAAQRSFAQGFQAQQAGRLPEAIQGYRQATQLDPADFDAYYNLGLAAAAAGNLQQALVAYEFALAIRPESPDARYNFAMVLKRANYLADAVHELNKLLSMYPKEPRAHLALGNIYTRIPQQSATAREHYLKVLEFDPHNPESGSIREWLLANPP